MSFVIVLALTACSSQRETTVVENGNVTSAMTRNTNDGITIDTPNDNDLRLETDNYIIHIDATPGRKYRYNIWANADNTSTAPDVVIEDGVVISEKE
ncbi:MAG: hypothetical protein IJ560_01030 [Alphaproteobacteria bacterium]|nr:hypothetical protein [Alphaproteobacteria bacterium]